MLSPRSRSRSSSPSPLLPGGSNKSTSPRYNSRRSLYTFLGTAAATGVLFHLVFVGFGGGEAVRQVPGLKDWLPPKPEVKIIYESCPDNPPTHGLPDPKHPDPAPSKPEVGVPAPAPHTHTKPNAHQHSGDADDEEDLNLDEVKQMVAKTKGYYGKDFSLGLGWNNVRYIVEASLLQATLLNRTLVLPSFVYARSCEWEIDSCAAFAPMVNRGDAIGWGEWRDLPIEQQMGWRVPMKKMIDFANLRKKYNVITMAEYLKIQGLDPTIEWSNGAWHRTDYQAGPMKPSLHVIPNAEFDPGKTVRVDNLKGVAHVAKVEMGNKIYERLLLSLGTNIVMDYSQARAVLSGGVLDLSTDEKLEKVLAENGWATLYTFAGALGMDYLKSVIEPIRQTTPLNRLKGFVEDYDHINTDVMVLEGETHLGRKPGGMRFTTTPARDEFARAVLFGLRPIKEVRRLADKLAERMSTKTQGRLWMSGHMRRGDFVRVGWAMEGTIEKHLARIQDRLRKGRYILEGIHEKKDVKTFEVPDVKPDQTLITHPPPNEGDPFYIATDERSKDGMKYIKDNGGILIGDLLTVEDRQEFGWPIMLTDVLALVEQSLLAKAGYFYAHAMSSVAGGVGNMRAARGADPRTTLYD